MGNFLDNLQINTTPLTWDVQVFTKDTVSTWGEELVSHKLFLINHVPVVVFYFSNPEENFFVSINYTTYNRASDDWMLSPILHFTLKLINSEYGNVLDYKVVKLSKEERSILIQACKNHIGIEPEFIDASTDFLYDNDFITFDWLCNKNIDY